MKLLFADDHTLFREAICNFVASAEPRAEITQARDVHEVMSILEGGLMPDLVLLDLHMPGMNGLLGMRKLRATYPDMALALMSGLAEKRDVDEARLIGASGYFPKTLSSKTLVHGIKHILDGGQFFATDHNTDEIMPSYFSDEEAEAIAVAGRAGLPPNLKLTPREIQVLEFLMRGESNKEIARALDLQVVTVKLHVRGVCRKLGAKNRTQAALLARGELVQRQA